MAFRALIVISLCLITVLQLAGAGSAPDKLNGLLDNSPFGVSRANAAAGNATADPLEFRSVYEEKGNKYFSIYDTATHRSTWVELNDPVNGFSIKAYDGAHENITVDYHNKPLTLSLKRAAAVAQAAVPVSPVPLPGGVPPPNSPGLAAPSPADAQRLQQIQEEIRRRRAQRQQPQVPQPSSGPQLLPSNSPGPQPIPAKP